MNSHTQSDRSGNSDHDTSASTDTERVVTGTATAPGAFTFERPDWGVRDPARLSTDEDRLGMWIRHGRLLLGGPTDLAQPFKDLSFEDYYEAILAILLCARYENLTHGWFCVRAIVGAAVSIQSQDWADGISEAIQRDGDVALRLAADPGWRACSPTERQNDVVGGDPHSWSLVNGDPSVPW
jgi:hypothetical protein